MTFLPSPSSYIYYFLSMRPIKMYSNIIKQIEIQGRVTKLRKHHHLYRVIIFTESTSQKQQTAGKWPRPLHSPETSVRPVALKVLSQRDQHLGTFRNAPSWAQLWAVF